MEFETLEELIMDVKGSTLAQAGAMINFIIKESEEDDPGTILGRVKHVCNIFINECPEDALGCFNQLIEERNAEITE